MSSPDKGIEDSPNWGGIRTQVIENCAECKQPLLGGRHCAERGCAWCAKCGAKARMEKKEK